MQRVGVRALQQNASAVLRRVREGEPLQVTERGHPVALLVPVKRSGILAELESSGRLSKARGDLLGLGEPLPKPKEHERPSARLARMRARER